MRGIASLYVWTLWRRYCDCYCAYQLRRREGCCRDDHEEKMIVIDYFLYTDMQLRWTAAPTLLLLHCASSGNDS
jgi:hypothetical protein